jgi:protein SCO1/2/putative membrane protein
MRAQLSPYKVDPDSGKLSKDGDAEGIGENDISRPSDIGPFELIERSGRKITNQDLRGKPWAVCFVFTRCAGPCLGISSKMAMLQKELKGASARLVTITVDPKYDTPEVLQNYAENFGADPDRWLFLTGEPDYVYRLLRGSFRQLVQEMTGKERQKGWEVFHTDDILHIDAEGRIVKRYHGTNDADMIRLRMALLAEAKQLAEKPRTETSAESSSSSLPAVAEKPTGSEGDQ